MPLLRVDHAADLERLVLVAGNVIAQGHERWRWRRVIERQTLARSQQPFPAQQQAPNTAES